MVTATNLTTGSASSGTSANTASISPSGNKLIIVTVANYKSGTANTPTVSGDGLTFVQIQTTSGQSGTWKITMFRAMVASPSSGALTIDFGGNNQAAGIHWTVDQFDNVKTTGANGADAVVQSAIGTGGGSSTGLTVTLGAFANLLNATYGAVNAQATISPGSGFSEISEIGGVPTNGILESEFKDTNDTSVDWTWSSASYGNGIAIEIAFQAPGAFFLLF